MGPVTGKGGGGDIRGKQIDHDVGYKKRLGYTKNGAAGPTRKTGGRVFGSVVLDEGQKPGGKTNRRN